MDGAKKITLGIRPDNFILHEEWMDTDKFAYLAPIKMKADIIEVLGGETIIYGYLINKEGEVFNQQTVRVKVTKDIDIRHGETIDLMIDLRKIHLFDTVTEKTLINKIPEHSAVNITIKGQKALMKKQSISLEKGLYSQVEEGAAQLFIPSNAISFKAGNIEAEVIHSEIVNDKKLFELHVDGNLIFALADTSLEIADGETTKISIDQSLVSLIQNGKEVKSFDASVTLHGRLEKSKKYKTYIYVIENVELPVKQERCQKLFNAKGHAILKTPLDFKTTAFAIDKTGNDFTGKVTAIFDYGKGRKFGKVLLPSNNSLLIQSDDLTEGGTITFSLDMDKTLIYDSQLNIILG